MPVFTIETPSGRKLDIEAADQTAAIRGAQDWESKQPSPNTAGDVAKQAASGLVEGAVEGIPAATPRFMELLSKGVTPLLKKVLPESKVQSMDQAEQERQNLKALIAANYKPTSIGSVLPEPQTPAGVLTRNITGAVGPAVAGIGGVSVPRAATAGLAAGTASELAGRATEGSALEPWARIAAGMAAGGKIAAGGIPRTVEPQVAAATGEVGGMFQRAKGLAKEAAPYLAAEMVVPHGLGIGGFLAKKVIESGVKAGMKGRTAEVSPTVAPEVPVPAATPAAAPATPVRPPMDVAYAQALLRDLARQNSGAPWAAPSVREAPPWAAPQNADMLSTLRTPEMAPGIARLTPPTEPTAVPKDVLAQAKALSKGLQNTARMKAKAEAPLRRGTEAPAKAPAVATNAPAPQKGLTLEQTFDQGLPPVAPSAAGAAPKGPQWQTPSVSEVPPPAVSDYANLGLPEAAKSIVAQIKAEKPDFKFYYGEPKYTEATLRRLTEKEGIASAVSNAAPDVRLQTVRAWLQAAKTRADAQAVKEHLKTLAPEAADAIEAAFTKERLKAGWKK